MQRKLFVTALGAFGFGALAGWAVTADIYEKRMKQETAQLDELVANKTEHIWALQDRIEYLTRNDEAANGDPNQISTDELIETQGEIELPEDETPEETRTNLQRLIDTYTADPDAQEEFVNMTTQSTEDDNAPPFVISRATYAWDEEGEHFDKITLTYYPRDRVLLDDEEDPIKDVVRTVGWRSLSQFGGESEDPDVVFIRNRRMETDFEVIKDEETPLPLHVKYGMEKEEFRANKAAGLIKFRQEDDDHRRR